MNRRVLIDVSHTFGHPFNTGVQRVVRQLASWARHWPETTFVRFDRVAMDFVPLQESDVDALIAGGASDDRAGHPIQAEPPRRRFATLRSVIGKFPGARAFIDGVRHRRAMRALRKNPRQVDFTDAIYLTAEVFGEPDRTANLTWWFRRHRTEVILIVHDLIPHFHPEWSIFDAAHFKNYLSIVSRANLLLPVSEHTKRQVVQWFGETSRKAPPLQVVRPGFDLPSGAKDRPPRLADLGPFLANVGTLEPRKNQVLLLGVLQSLWKEGKQFSFVFAGKEAAGYQMFSKAFAEARKEGYPVHWLNPASEEEVSWIYSNALATVYPSLSEGFGLPIVESVARGTPCITSSWSATGEIAADLGGCLAVEPTNFEELKSAVCRIVESEELRKQLVSSIRSDRFRLWEHYARDVQTLVSECVAGSFRSRK